MPQFRAKLPSIGPRPPEAPAETPADPAPALTGGPDATPPEPASSGAAPAAATPDGDASATAVLVPLESVAAARARSAGRPGTPASHSGADRSSPRLLRGAQRPFLHMPTFAVPSWSAIESSARELLAGPAEAVRPRTQNPRELSDSIAMGKAIWRELVIGFAAQLGELNLGFTQLAALYALADSGTMTVSDMADTLGRSPSAVSRLVDSLVQRQLVERTQDVEDRRQRTIVLTARGKAVLGRVDRARAEEFLSIVRPLRTPERAIVAMGVAALSSQAISKRGRLIKIRRPRTPSIAVERR